MADVLQQTRGHQEARYAKVPQQPTVSQVQQRIQAHDRYQVEFKLDYELVAGQPTRYEVLTYIFIPQSLGVTPGTYSQPDFYRDIQNYVRLKTPTFSLRALAHDPASPLVTIEGILYQEGWNRATATLDQVTTCLKFLRAIMKSTLRDQLSLLHEDIRKECADQIANDVDNVDMEQKVHRALAALLDDTITIVRRFRNIYPHLRQTNVDATTMLTYRLTDESLSLLIEESLLEAYTIANQHITADPQRKQILHSLRYAIEAETVHRRRHGRDSIPQSAGDNEKFLFRSSVLKKFTSSVLFLRTDVQREGTTMEHLLYALAAGISMFFATVIAFYFQSAYGNFTLPFFSALVVGYMFKDRIKETGRDLSARLLHNRMYDRRITIRSQDGQHQLGYLREKMRLISTRDVPADVLAARNYDLYTELDNDGQGENVIFYAKEVVLYRDIFAQIYRNSPPITGLNDILRFDVRPYLRKMADPVQRRPYLDGDEVQLMRLQKVYHVNVVTVYRTMQPQATTITRTRLVLNRKGVRRVENVPVTVS